MGLDAHVYCDCILQGRIRTPHPFPELLYLDEDGCPQIRSDNLEQQIQHDMWMWRDACIHQNCTLVHHRLGNISHIAYLRQVVQQLQQLHHSKYEIILDRILVSGSHAGDRIIAEQIPILEHELADLSKRNHLIQNSNSRNDLIHCIQQLEELVQASRKTGYPIAF